MTLATPALATRRRGVDGHARSSSLQPRTSPAGHYACLALRRADLGFTPAAKLAANPTATPSGYGPSSLQSAYKLPSSTAGSGQRVYVVDAYDDPNAEPTSRPTARSTACPPAPTANGCFQKLNQNGATSPLPAGDTGWAGEISLDLDMVSAICPNCGITLIEANDALGQPVHRGQGGRHARREVRVDELGRSRDRHRDELRHAPTSSRPASSTRRRPVTAPTPAGVIYPATSPRVVAVGGTALKTASNAAAGPRRCGRPAARRAPDPAARSDEAKPSWQSTRSAPRARAARDCGRVGGRRPGHRRRGLPDLRRQRLGRVRRHERGGADHRLDLRARRHPGGERPTRRRSRTRTPANLFDVTSGNNGTCSPTLLCTAAAGWDGPTGLGTPNGVTAFGGTGGGGGNTVTVTNPGSKTGTVGTATSLQMSATDSGGAVADLQPRPGCRPGCRSRRPG